MIYNDFFNRPGQGLTDLFKSKRYMKKRFLFVCPQYILRKFSWKAVIAMAFSIFFTGSVHAQQWSIIGNENQISSFASFYTSITVIDNVPYIAYVEGTASGGTGKVKRKNTTTGAWDQVGSNLMLVRVNLIQMHLRGVLLKLRMNLV